jgi:hypothetical protein
VHAPCKLDTWGYRQTLRICNSYCFSTATLVAKARLDVTLYILCLSCHILKGSLQRLTLLWTEVLILGDISQKKTVLAFLITYKAWSLRNLLRTTYHATVCSVCVPLAQYPPVSRCRHYGPHYYFSFHFGMLPSFVKKLGTCPVIYWLLPVLIAVLRSSLCFLHNQWRYREKD